MEVGSFGLGIRFDMLEEYSEKETLSIICEELFSVLTLSDVEGLRLYGGFRAPEHPSDVNIYMMVFTHGSLKVMRNIYKKLDDDAGINMYFASTHPYYENNRLERIDGLTYFGVIQSNGRITGGDYDLTDVVVSKKRGRRKLSGKGLKIMIAPEGFKDGFTSLEAIKRLTIAARRNIPGVKVVPLPITDGGNGTVEALVMACNGATREIEVKNADLLPQKAKYGILYGDRAIVDITEALSAHPYDNAQRTSSFGAGEIICRVLDEGIRNVIIALDEVYSCDGGMGCARALGVKFYDNEGLELTGDSEDLLKIVRIDTEFMHPMIKNTKFSLIVREHTNFSGENGAVKVFSRRVHMMDSDREYLDLGMENLKARLTESFSVDLDRVVGAGCAGGASAMLHCLLGIEYTNNAETILKAINIDKLLKGVALVVIGVGAESLRNKDDREIFALMEKCDEKKVPVAVLTYSAKSEADVPSKNKQNSAVFVMDQSDERDIAKFLDIAANRMFSLIKVGRGVERIGALLSIKKRGLRK